jgi:hypothetical protein
MGLLGAFHGIVTGVAARRALKKEIDQVREAHRLLADAMESTQGALTELAHAIESGALSDTDALTGEVRMLETLVQQMSESIDHRLASRAPASASRPSKAVARPSRTSCCAPSTRRSARAGSICICSPSSPCPSAGPSSTRASPVCATRPTGS